MTNTRRPAVVLVALAAAVVVLAMMTNVVPFREVLAQRAEIDSAGQELAGLVAENAMLTQQVAALETPIEIERIAREKLGYVRPGETAYVVIGPEGPVSSPVVSEVTEPYAEPNILERVWAYVTGADLVSR